MAAGGMIRHRAGVGRLRGRALGESDIIAFAKQWDPQPWHVDPVAAARTPVLELRSLLMVRTRPAATDNPS